MTTASRSPSFTPTSSSSSSSSHEKRRRRRVVFDRRRRSTRVSSSSLERLVTTLAPETLETLVASASPQFLFRRVVLLRRLVPRGDLSYMISLEPMLVSDALSDEEIEYRANDATEALRARVKFDNVREFMVEQEPSLLLGLGGQMRLDEIRDAAAEHEANLASIAGDGKAWLGVREQQFVSNFFVKC